MNSKMVLVATAGSVAVVAGCLPAPTVTPGYTSRVIAYGGSSLSKPDDITTLGGRIYVSFQNGVGSKGEPAPSHATQSTVRGI